MVIKKVNLDIVVGVTSTLPETSFPEVAFAGKSNVGKSSLINALMNRKSYTILMTVCILLTFRVMDMLM